MRFAFLHLNRSLDCKFTCTSTHKTYQLYIVRCNLFGNRGAWHCKNAITGTAPLSVWVILINRSLDCKFTCTSSHKTIQRYIKHWNLFGNRGRDTAITKIPFFSKSQSVIVSPNRAYGRLTALRYCKHGRESF